MKTFYYSVVKLLISIIFSVSILFAVTSIIRYTDTAFTISLFDLLSKITFAAWLLWALLTGVIFKVLSQLPVFADAKEQEHEKTNGEGIEPS